METKAILGEYGTKESFLFFGNKGTMHIMITSPCNVYPLTPQFYLVKMGFTGVNFFLIFAPKHRLWVLVRTASLRKSMFEQK